MVANLRRRPCAGPLPSAPMAALWDRLRLLLLRRRLHSLDARLIVAISRAKALRKDGSCAAAEHNEHVCAVLATARAVARAELQHIKMRARQRQTGGAVHAARSRNSRQSIAVRENRSTGHWPR